MNYSCIFIIISLVVHSDLAELTSFDEWQLKHGKQYKTSEERIEREIVFNENLKLINQLNLQHKDREIKFGENQFTDLTTDEFKQLVLMAPQQSTDITTTAQKHGGHMYVPKDNFLPDTYDWRTKNVVTSVKDQGTVGSCWAFSTVANIEGQWALAGNTLTSLSPEQLVDCDDTYDPNNLHMDCGVFGGWPYLGYQYVKKAGGIESEADYPYCSGKGTCYPCVPKGWNKTRCGPPPTYCNDTFSCFNKIDKSKFVNGLKVKDWMAVSKNETEMLDGLVNRGPLSVLINAELLQFYHSGVWDPFVKCDPSSLDHAVLLVGYGTHKGILSDKPYWLIKNSWGTKWGEDGYFMLIRGKGKCGIDQQVTSAILE